MKRKVKRVTLECFEQMLEGQYYKWYEQPQDGKITLSVKCGKKRMLISGEMVEDIYCCHTALRLGDYLCWWTFVPDSEQKKEKILAYS